MGREPSPEVLSFRAVVDKLDNFSATSLYLSFLVRTNLSLKSLAGRNAPVCPNEHRTLETARPAEWRIEGNPNRSKKLQDGEEMVSTHATSKSRTALSRWICQGDATSFVPIAEPSRVFSRDSYSSREFADWLTVYKSRQTHNSVRQTITRDKGCEEGIRRITLKSCPWCHSERTHLSRRKGILEKTILTVLFVRPFRCSTCDHRFFRASFLSNPNESRTVTTHLGR
jgi:hypothetical protein